MNPRPDKDEASLPLTLVDKVCDRFEKACQKAGRSNPLPSLADYLGQTPELAHSEALRGLLILERAYRQERGEQPTEDEYLARFPSMKTAIQEIWSELRSRETSDLAEATDGPDPLRGFLLQDEPVFKVRYELLNTIGRGGMGIVYKALDKDLQREVAIKVTSPGAATDRFRREAQLLAKIKSRFVVTVYDFQMLSNGLAMIVMEWVDGTNLHRFINEYDGLIPEDKVVPLMRDVCEGMWAAAEQGIIHRDLKPSNLLIDSQGRARVADFGLARGQTMGGDLSHTGQTMGTAFYMAPEQAEDPRSVDTRADIYSFGATFYHALTGKPPFEGPSQFTILFKHKTEIPIPPRSLRPELSERISNVIERCLAKSPGDRFASFAEVVKNLQPPPRHQETKPIALGTVVQARWKGGKRFYQGKVTAIEGERIHIDYDDGGREWTTANLVRLADGSSSLDLGSVVLCRWKGGPRFFRGKITDIERDRIHIDYDDGDKEWTTANLILALGTIVQCRWKGGPYCYQGKITGFDGNRIHVDYDDGDKEWTTTDMIQR